MTRDRDGAHWRDKYLAALDQQEKLEHQLKRQSELLSRGLNRLLLAAEGQHRSLDESLATLRQLLRQGNVSERQLLDSLASLEGPIKALETLREQRGRAVVLSARQLTEQLVGLRPGSEHRRRLRRFEKDARVRAGHLFDHSLLLEEFSKLQADVLEACRGEPQYPWWQFWKRQSEGAEPGETTLELVAADPKVDEVDLISQTIEGELAEGGETPLSGHRQHADALVEAVADAEFTPFEQISSEVTLVLADLVAQIDAPESVRPTADALNHRLGHRLRWFELVPVLEDMRLLVVAALDADQRDFQQFLNQLNQRLADAAELLLSSQQAQAEEALAVESYDRQLREQLAGMHDQMLQAEDLDTLKGAVRQRLDQILAAMDHFKAREHQRESTLAQQLAQLAARVEHMEQESKQAQQRLEESRQQALRDVLTQLPNREAWELRLHEEVSRWQRYQRPLALVVSDIDHFKRINDTYGHQAGDKVLRIIAKTLRKRLREADFIARYGGEEFVILMPETNAQDACQVVDMVRQAVASCPFHFREEPVAITLSFGVTEFCPGDQIEQVFERADQALYQAKRAGRNRCEIAPESRPSVTL